MSTSNTTHIDQLKPHAADEPALSETATSASSRRPSLLSKDFWKSQAELGPEERDEAHRARQDAKAQAKQEPKKTKPKKTHGFRAAMRTLFSSGDDELPPQELVEEHSIPQMQVLEIPDGPEAPKVDKEDDHERFGKKLGMEPRNLPSQKDEKTGKWKVDMRYVANYTADVEIMRKEKEGDSDGNDYANPRKYRFAAKVILSGQDKRVDPAMKEQYLSDGEFENIFGMTKVTFNQMPLWKRQNLKAKVGFQ